MTASAIIAASGQGRRMGGAVRKQYMMLDRVPVLARTINTFVEHGAFLQVIVVIPQGEVAATRRILKPFSPVDSLIFVEGGRRREDPVYNALQAVNHEVELVCIHDGARPLLTAALIEAVLESAGVGGAAVPVIAVTDTIKEVSEEGLIKRTVSREKLRRVQTPQAFRLDLILEAYQKSAILGIEATDDSYLLELLGYAVATVPGETANLKITGPEDLIMAEALLRGEL